MSTTLRTHEQERTYLCIDLKSFYASVECVDRGLDPFTTDLVVADPTRSDNTICLAITPALKAKGVPNRCRIREIPRRLSYITAMPRMRRYMEISRQIYDVYLEFFSPLDIYPYSIDEVLIDITPYLKRYELSSRALAQRVTQRVRKRYGICATAGIGPNLFLAKVALDLHAKHSPDGIAQLSLKDFYAQVWFHHPITDIWGIGKGIARRLAERNIYDLAGICAEKPEVLHRMFGKNARYLIDHAWGLEPCSIQDIRSYVPRAHSMTNGQVLMRDYSAQEARTILLEMAYDSCMELIEKGLACDSVGLYIGYSASMFKDMLPEESRQARKLGITHGGGQRRLGRITNSSTRITEALTSLYDETVDPQAQIRRVNITLSGLHHESYVSYALFDDHAAEQKEYRLNKAMIAVRKKFGKNALLTGTSLKAESNARERNDQVGGHRG